MDLVVNKLQSTTENEEEDYESFFLQPASSPYNIAERVQQANIDLYNNTSVATMEKTSRVTFREELDSYEPEPELTDDDVNSLESDPTETEAVVPLNHHQVLEYKSTSVINLNIFDLNEEEEVEEEVIEVIGNSESEEYGAETKPFDNKIAQDSYQYEDRNSENNTIKKQIDDTTVRISSDCSKKSNTRKKTRKKSSGVSPNIDCKNHCIERLDFGLSFCIKRLEIQEKPVNCPLLKLQKRKCCDENKAKNPTNLPCYNGLRSEYGLSSAELEKRERRKQIIKLKEQKRQQLLQEYKNRRDQQNEEVFSQWLKDVAKRKALKQKIDGSRNVVGEKQSLTPTIINFPTKANEKVKERPKTANEFVPRHAIKKAPRPHTSAACVFIEVPPKLLKRGVHIGDLLVTNSNLAAKKMHIMTISS